MAISDYNWSDPATFISFVVDNNPKAVAAALTTRGHNINGLSIQEYKELMLRMYQKGVDLTWVGDTPYIPTANNWTGQYGSAGRGASSTAKSANDFVLENKDIIGLAASILGGIFGIPILGGLGGGSQPQPQYQPQEDTILGMPKSTFYIMGFILLILIVLFIVVMRKK